MRISVLGAVVYDEIITHRGERRESYGGITYNVAAFCSIVPDDTVVVPVSNVAEDHFEHVVSLMSQYPQVELAELQRVPGKLTHAKLTYETVSRRDESVRHMMRPLTPDRITSCKKSDAILMNFVNGTEIDLPTFAALRKQIKAPIHLDVHSKVGRWDSEGKKTLVPFSDWRDWVQHLDIIQMNEFESELIVGRKLTGYADYVSAAAEIADGGAPIVAVTLGPLGSVLVYRKNGKRYSSVCPAADVENVIDTTCGTIFSVVTRSRQTRRRTSSAESTARSPASAILRKRETPWSRYRAGSPTWHGSSTLTGRAMKYRRGRPACLPLG